MNRIEAILASPVVSTSIANHYIRPLGTFIAYDFMNS